jgi:protein TonB
MSSTANDSSFMSRRAAVFLAIVGLHVFLIWALATGLARRLVETIAPPLQTDIVEEVQKHDEPPPPPPPQMERPPVEVPPPEVSIDIPVETTSTAIQDVTDRPQPKAPPPPPPPPPKPEAVEPGIVEPPVPPGPPAVTGAAPRRGAWTVVAIVWSVLPAASLIGSRV